MAKISKDLNAGNLHPRETIYGVGNLGSNGAELIIDCDGAESVTLDLRGTFSLTIEVSGSVDGVNWTQIPMRPVNQTAVAYLIAIAGTSAGVWVGMCAQYRQIRARVTVYTSGTAITTIAADLGAIDQTLQGILTSSQVTATGASGAGVTLTLPAPGLTLRQYLTYITIVRSATAVLTASATPTVITTTNLPGALAFTMGLDASAIGIDKTIQEDFSYPVASSAQNTATTIVAPAVTGVIWRITAGYYLAP